MAPSRGLVGGWRVPLRTPLLFVTSTSTSLAPAWNSASRCLVFWCLKYFHSCPSAASLFHSTSLTFPLRRLYPLGADLGALVDDAAASLLGAFLVRPLVPCFSCLCVPMCAELAPSVSVSACRAGRSQVWSFLRSFVPTYRRRSCWFWLPVCIAHFAARSVYIPRAFKWRYLYSRMSIIISPVYLPTIRCLLSFQAAPQLLDN